MYGQIHLNIPRNEAFASLKQLPDNCQNVPLYALLVGICLFVISSLPSEVLASEKSVYLSSGLCVCVGCIGFFWATVCLSVVLFIRHLCVRIIMGCVCLVCEGAIDSSTHSSHIPRYKAKQTGTCSLVEKSRWDCLTRLGAVGGQGRARPEQLTTHNCPHHC